MPQQDPAQQETNPPESVIVDHFDGIKNTVAPERLGPNDLEFARNINLDDTGQASRRRGYNRVIAAKFRSLQNVGMDKCFAVRDGWFGRIRDDYSFVTIFHVGDTDVSATHVADKVYFSCTTGSGVISADDSVRPWGLTNGQGTWLSPVVNPTAYLGEVAGKLLGDPPRATQVLAFHGRIYLAQGSTLWRTELYQYDAVDRTKGFYPFEHDITLLMAVDDGLYVGTTGGLYFLGEERILMREFGALKLDKIVGGPVVPGSGVEVPVDLVHPGAMSQPLGTGMAIVFLNIDGIMAGFNGGETFNLTVGRVQLPQGLNAAALFRQDQGANSYVAAVDSEGGPISNARIGDYVDAQIIRASETGGI